jgi:hypothetical protein
MIMPLTPEQLAAGRAVKRALSQAEKEMRKLHRRLAELRDAFRDDMGDEEFVTFGGGTNKDDEGPPGP